MKLVFSVAAVILVFVTSAFVRVNVEASKVHTAQSIQELTHALRWRVSANQDSLTAKQRLEACAFDVHCSEQVAALRGLRQGITASRSWLTNEDDKQLLKKISEVERLRIGVNPITLLDQPQWNPSMQLFAQLSLWIWLLAIYLFIWKGINHNGTLMILPASGFILIWALGFLSWLFCLSLA